MLYSWISLQIVSFSIDYQLTIFNYIWTMLHIVTLCSTIVAVFCMPQWCFTMVDLKIVWICLNTHSIFHICGIDIYIYIYIYLYGNDIKICGGRARPRGPGGSIKYQFVYLNVVMFKWIGFRMFKWPGGPRKTLPRGSLKYLFVYF